VILFLNEFLSKCCVAIITPQRLLELVPTALRFPEYPNIGHIVAVFGPMFSGKTKYLEVLKGIWDEEQIPYALFNSVLDARYSEDEHAVTHDQTKIPAIKVETTDDIKAYLDENPLVKHICVDEANLIPGIYELAIKLKWQGFQAHYLGLNQTSEQRPLMIPTETGAGFSNLIAIADETFRLYSDCSYCKAPGIAEYSFFRAGKTDDVAIAGPEAYDALCPSCFGKAAGLLD
jgi:thymidine kinase